MSTDLYFDHNYNWFRSAKSRADSALCVWLYRNMAKEIRNRVRIFDVSQKKKKKTAFVNGNKSARIHENVAHIHNARKIAGCDALLQNNREMRESFTTSLRNGSSRCGSQVCENR